MFHINKWMKGRREEWVRVLFSTTGKIIAIFAPRIGCTFPNPNVLGVQSASSERELRNTSPRVWIPALPSPAQSTARNNSNNCNTSTEMLMEDEALSMLYVIWILTMNLSHDRGQQPGVWPTCQTHLSSERMVWNYPVAWRLSLMPSLCPFSGLQPHRGNNKCCSFYSYPAFSRIPSNLPELTYHLVLAMPCHSWKPDPILVPLIAVWDVVWT